MDMATPSKSVYERHKSFDSPETVLVNKKKLNRSSTITASHSPSVSSQSANDRASPLKRFGDAKENIKQKFGHIRDHIVKIDRFLSAVHEDGQEQRVQYLLEKAAGIEEMLARDHMKVVFFGRTSNGKSTVINSMLQAKVLPSGIGHTTNCFCSVTGVDSDDEGYIIIPESDSKRDIKSLQQLAHSLYKDRLSTSNLIRVYWPKSKCSLLQADVEFVDSPGVDMNPDVDDWINQHCLDADVFVLVANSESTLMSAEKNFFHRVSERLSRPNVFILNNRWDCSALEPEMMDEVRGQHLENDVTFLTKQLNVVDEVTANDRVYFVSAKEVLLMRMRQQNNEQDPGRGLADGHKGRLAEFERFELKLKKCLSSSAIRTKFEQHHSRGTEIILELEELLKSEEEFICERSLDIEEQLKQICLEKHQLEGLSSSVRDSAEEILAESDTAVRANVTSEMKVVLNDLQGCITAFNHQDGFISSQTEEYKHSLYQHIDNHLKSRMANLCESCLKVPHHNACEGIIKLFNQLPERLLSSHSPNIETPRIPFKIASAEICQGFVEDLEFNFSLGITSLTGLATKLNLGAIALKLHQYISRLTGHIPSEVVFPLTLVSGGFILSRMMSWRYIVLPLTIYGGIYAFEKFTWTDSKREKALKNQVFHHLKDRLKPQTVAVQNSYSSVLLADLQKLYSSLDQALQGYLVERENSIHSLEKESGKLNQLQGEAHKLKNSVGLIRRDLEDFKEEYLDDVD